jgi:hypothetical protein
MKRSNKRENIEFLKVRNLDFENILMLIKSSLLSWPKIIESTIKTNGLSWYSTITGLFEFCGKEEMSKSINTMKKK